MRKLEKAHHLNKENKMKVTKMSLVAAMLLGTGLFAIENTKIEGNAQTFYQTTDANNIELFDKDNSSADMGINLNVSSDLVKTDSVSISTGVGATFLTTLGLENNLVSGVWGNAHTATAPSGSSFGAKVDNASWVNEAWLAATTGKTTAKVGRMALDTPLAFTETWSIEKNTFEAGVLINEDIPDTTLVGAYIGNGNGAEFFGNDYTTASSGAATGGIVNANGGFTTFGSDGAYAVGVVNNSIKPLTLQAWYYDVTRVVEAYWLQADLACEKIPGLMAGAQYSGHTLSKDAVMSGTPLGLAKDVSSDVYAFMLGYEMADTFTIKGSYSQVGKDFRAGFNTATNADFAQSKLYTEAWWMYGSVTQADTASYNITFEAPVADLFDFGAYYTNADQAEAAGNNDVSDFTAVASKSFGPLDTSLVYSNIDGEFIDQYNQIQLYLTLNF